jgi:Uma2 family endonuclease
MAVQDRLYTADDLEKMPNDGKTYELHNGVLIEVAGSGERQSTLAAWIIYLLFSHLMEHKLGGTVTGADGTYVLAAYNTRIPDVAYVREQQDIVGFHRGAPDLAVEVVSPSNSPQEMQQRAGEYLNAGSSLVWIVNPDTLTVDVYLQGGTRTVYSGSMILDGGDVIPGLKLPVSRIFERIK